MKWKGCRRKQSLHNLRYYTDIRKDGENYTNPGQFIASLGTSCKLGSPR